MLRTLLLSALAVAALGGCATDYSYRGGDGDYYYSQPRVEYRYQDPYGYSPYGYYGGGYTQRYYYDRFGRLVYGNPYAYYGYPYGDGSQYWWYRPRPQHPGHHQGDQDGDDHDGDRNDRKPPWRDIGSLPPRNRGTPGAGDEGVRPRRQSQPFTMPAPQRMESPPSAPRMRSNDGGGSRMGRMIRNSKASDPASDD